MGDQPDRSNAIIRPPIALLIAFVLGFALDWLYPLPFVPASIPPVLTGGAIFAAGFALAVWAIVTIRRAGTEVETTKPTTAIVTGGPFRFTRNPIYAGMLLGLVGLAISFNSLWILGVLIPFFAIIRFGVVAREEAYLERKFGDAYRGYKARVRRWV